MSTYSAAMKVGKYKAFANIAEAFLALCSPCVPPCRFACTKGNYVDLNFRCERARETLKGGARDIEGEMK